jgi:ABC-type Zn uptake system ZnuABC Zn-binding protein ZnuA
VALAGEKLAGRYDGEKLAVLAAHGKLEEFLQKQGAADLLGGWLGRLAPFRGAQLVADHNLWPYFAERFGLKVVGFLEPKPGIAPTTKHLGALVETMKGLGVRGILSVPYFNVRHAEFVAGATGARVIPVAHQCGSQPGTDGYIAMVNHNVDAIAAALGGKK